MGEGSGAVCTRQRSRGRCGHFYFEKGIIVALIKVITCPQICLLQTAIKKRESAIKKGIEAGLSLPLGQNTAVNSASWWSGVDAPELAAGLRGFDDRDGLRWAVFLLFLFLFFPVAITNT